MRAAASRREHPDARTSAVSDRAAGGARGVGGTMKSRLVPDRRAPIVGFVAIRRVASSRRRALRAPRHANAMAPWRRCAPCSGTCCPSRSWPSGRAPAVGGRARGRARRRAEGGVGGGERARPRKERFRHGASHDFETGASLEPCAARAGNTMRPRETTRRRTRRLRTARRAPPPEWLPWPTVAQTALSLARAPRALATRAVL